MRILVLALCLVIVACATPVAETRAQMVYAAESDYRGILSLALDYESIPRCPQPAGFSCSDPVVVEAIRKANRVARAAFDSAGVIALNPLSTNSDVINALDIASKATRALHTILVREGVSQ